MEAILDWSGSDPICEGMRETGQGTPEMPMQGQNLQSCNAPNWTHRWEASSRTRGTELLVLWHDSIAIHTIDWLDHTSSLAVLRDAGMDENQYAKVSGQRLLWGIRKVWHGKPDLGI